VHTLPNVIKQMPRAAENTAPASGATVSEVRFAALL
jgi:hypothetical protein